MSGQWHPDPTGRHQMRYWDGARWTDHVSDNGIQSTDPVSGPPAPMGGGAPPGWAGPGQGAYGQYPVAQQGYYGGGYGGVQQRREHPQGTTILVLGILGLVVCGILCPIAWAMGNTARREMLAQPNVVWTNKGSVDGGRICGMIGTILYIIGIVFFVIILIAAANSDPY